MKVNGLYAVLLVLFFLSCRGANKLSSGNSLNIDQLVNKMTEVSGGDSAIAAIKTHVSKHSIAGGLETFTITYKRPDKVRLDFFFQDTITFSTSTDGKNGWVFIPDMGVIDLHPMKTSELISLAEHYIDEWRLHKEIGLQIKLIGEVELENDRRCYKMQVTDRFGIEGIYYVNRDTYLMARIDYPEIDGATGEMGEMATHDFLDYSNIGVVFPTKELENGNRIIEMQKWINNTAVNDSIFNLREIDVTQTTRLLSQIAESGSLVE